MRRRPRSVSQSTESAKQRCRRCLGDELWQHDHPLRNQQILLVLGHHCQFRGTLSLCQFRGNDLACGLCLLKPMLQSRLRISSKPVPTATTAYQRQLRRGQNRQALTGGVRLQAEAATSRAAPKDIHAHRNQGIQMCHHNTGIRIRGTHALRNHGICPCRHSARIRGTRVPPRSERTESGRGYRCPRQLSAGLLKFA